jgi:hypothetical protein
MKNGDGFMHLRKEEFLKSNFNEGDKYFELAGRAYDILMGNVYAPDAGFLWSPYRCLTP